MPSLSIKSVQERRDVAAKIIEPVLGGARDRKVSSTYKRLTPDKEGRIRTVLSPDTASFRMSSSNSLLWDSSTNLQNMEQKVAKLDPLYQVRDIFIPDEGYELFAIDYRGAEAVLCGAYSQDWDYVAKILAGADTHQELANFLFDVDPATKLQRDIGKTIRYASQYNAKVPTITQNLNKEADSTGKYYTIEEVGVLHRKLLLLHPLERWWDQTRRELEKSGGVMRNCFGYRRTFHDPDPDERLKAALSFLPQSTTAWLMNLTLADVHGTIDPQRSQLLLQIHDELLFQVVPDEIPVLYSYVKGLMERHFTIHDHDLYIPVEAKRGFSWGQMKKCTFPEPEVVL